MIQMSPELSAILLSLKVSAVATVLALPLAFLAAASLTFGRFRGRVLLDVLVNLPLTLPPVVIGYALVVLLGRQGWVGRWLEPLGLSLIFTWRAAVIATMVVGFPLMVRSIRTAMEGIDAQLIQAARSLGARPLDVLITVILPLSRRGLGAGAVLLFARGLGEFGATVIVAGNIPGRTQTIPLAIYDYASSPGGDRMALLLCGVSVLLSLAVLLLHERLVRGASPEA